MHEEEIEFKSSDELRIWDDFRNSNPVLNLKDKQKLGV